MKFVPVLLLVALALSSFGVMPAAQAQQPPVPLGCWKDQGDPQGTNGRDLNGYMFVAPAERLTAPTNRRVQIDRQQPVDPTIARIPPPPPPGMTNGMCTNECAKRGFAYAGTQFGSYCFCGNQYGRSGPAAACDATCNGNAGEKCGGTWANSVSWTGLNQPPAQGWTGSATCRVSIQGSSPSYSDNRTHTWTLIGAPALINGNEVYSAVWMVTGSGSKSSSSASASWTVRGGAGGPIKIGIRIADGKRFISADHSQLSTFNGVWVTQQQAGSNPTTSGAQAFEWAFPAISAAPADTVISGAINGPNNAPFGYAEPATAQGSYACSWNFQKR
jgi:hypothetical protein